jgi:hypothetical protein
MITINHAIPCVNLALPEERVVAKEAIPDLTSHQSQGAYFLSDSGRGNRLSSFPEHKNVQKGVGR